MVIAAKKKGAIVSAVRIAEAPGMIIVFGEEERGLGAISSVFVEQLIHRLQKSLRMLESDCTLASQVRL